MKAIGMRFGTLAMLLIVGVDARLCVAASPNFVIILADDLGYGDVKCYNPELGKIVTPHIDKLASEGMRFTDGHSSSGVCSPTRYALLTGRYHWRSRLQSGIVPYLGEPLIAPGRVTLASFVRQHGYRTACIGKWHLGWNWNIPNEQLVLFAPGRTVSPAVTDAHRVAWRERFTQPLTGGPLDCGFDEYFGTDVPNNPPYCFIENNRTLGIPTEFLPLPLLKNQLAGIGGPALANWRLEDVLPALVDRAQAFIRRQSEVQQPFLLYLPLTSPHTPIAVNEIWKGKSGLGAYADFVMETDAAVGKVLQALDASGLTENTLVIFTSDNGCAPSAYTAMRSQGHPSSGPLRDKKGSVYEGGHRVPLIARWPSVIRPNTTNDQLVHQADVLATLAAVLDAELPSNAAEDSFSWLPLLKGDDRPIREHAVSCAASGIPGLRQGAWKFIPSPDAGSGASSQLYDLASDLGEQTNRAAEQPGRVAAMSRLLDELITNGRSTPGTPQDNDVEVIRFPSRK